LGPRSRGFELCAEVNSRLMAIGVPIIESPISYRPRSVHDGKRIKLGDFFRSAFTYIRCRFRRAVVQDARTGRAPGHRWPWYSVTRFCAGILLLVAGASKLLPLRPIALTSWLVLPPAMVFAIGVFEVTAQ